jgi:hypothetical protein
MELAREYRPGSSILRCIARSRSLPPPVQLRIRAGLKSPPGNRCPRDKSSTRQPRPARRAGCTYLAGTASGRFDLADRTSPRGKVRAPAPAPSSSRTHLDTANTALTNRSRETQTSPADTPHTHRRYPRHCLGLSSPDRRESGQQYLSGNTRREGTRRKKLSQPSQRKYRSRIAAGGLRRRRRMSLGDRASPLSPSSRRTSLRGRRTE